MFNPGKQPSSRRDLMTLGVMTAMVLAILVYWSFGRARRKMEGDALPPPGEASEMITVEDDDPFKREVKRNRERDLAGRGEAAAAAAGEQGAGRTPVRPVTPDDLDWLTDHMKTDEAARTKFLPMLEKFTPLEYDAVRAFRALMQDRVPSGFRTRLVVPEGGEGAVVDAGPEGLTIEAAGGAKTKLAWDKVEIGEAYRIALEMTPPGASDAKARDLIYLAQLATLAGEADKAAEFRTKAAEFHFRAALGDGAPEETKALYEMARSLVDRRLSSPSEKETDRDALALDFLHLSRLASAAGQASDSAEHSERALALDPLLEDEAGGRASKSLDRWLLENESWAWDPDDPSGADVQTANDLAGDAEAVLHIYRYMRTLGPERLVRAAFEEPSYPRLLNLPRQTRGRVYRAECGFIRRLKTMRLTRRPEHVDAGVQEIDFLYLSAKDSPGGRTRYGIYLVCVPHETHFRQGDFLSLTGVYLRRWPFKKPNGNWRWIPWIVASRIETIEVRGTKGWDSFIFALLGLGAAGAVVLFFAARREWRGLVANRDRLNARRRGGRNMIRRKVAGAMAGLEKKDEPKPAPDDKPDDLPDDPPRNGSEGDDPTGDAGDGDEKKD